MPQYLASIELPGASDEQIEALHKEMASLGFLREIYEFPDIWRTLPKGTYSTVVPDTPLETARDAVVAAARKYCSGQPLVLVIELASWGGYLPCRR